MKSVERICLSAFSIPGQSQPKLAMFGCGMTYRRPISPAADRLYRLAVRTIHEFRSRPPPSLRVPISPHDLFHTCERPRQTFMRQERAFTQHRCMPRQFRSLRARSSICYCPTGGPRIGFAPQRPSQSLVCRSNCSQVIFRLCSFAKRSISVDLPKRSASSNFLPDSYGTTGAEYSMTLSCKLRIIFRSNARPTVVDRKLLVTLKVISTRFGSPHSARYIRANNDPSASAVLEVAIASPMARALSLVMGELQIRGAFDARDCAVDSLH